MKWVSRMLARGIVFSVLLLAGGRLSSSIPSSHDRALGFVRSQDFSPTYELVGDRIGGYFDSCDVEGFIEEVFSLGGKWKALTWSSASYEAYVAGAVESHLFSSRGMNDLLECVRGDFAFALQVSHNRLITLLHGEMIRERPGLLLETFRAEFEGLASGLASSVLQDLEMNVVSIVGSEAAVMITTAALGSVGVLGSSAAVGASTGPWTFGIGLAVGLTIGLVIDAVAGAECEDAARAQIRAQRDLLRNRLFRMVDGALMKGFSAHVRLQKACVLRLCQGARDGASAFDR